MDKRTRISTVASIIGALLVIINTILHTNIELSPETIASIATLIVMVATWANSHWFNQNFTKIACEKTGEMRLMKKQLNNVIEGENFYDEFIDEDPMTEERDGE